MIFLLYFCYYFTAVPEILFPPDNTVITVNQFQPVVLQCSAVGIPLPEFAWMRTRGGQNQTLMTSASITISDPFQIDNYQLSGNRGLAFRVSSNLTISTALDADRGSYYCVASNTPGNDVQAIEVVIQGETLTYAIRWLINYFIIVLSCTKHHNSSN